MLQIDSGVRRIAKILPRHHAFHSDFLTDVMLGRLQYVLLIEFCDRIRVIHLPPFGAPKQMDQSEEENHTLCAYCHVDGLSLGNTLHAQLLGSAEITPAQPWARRN